MIEEFDVCSSCGSNNVTIRTINGARFLECHDCHSKELWD